MSVAPDLSDPTRLGARAARDATVQAWAFLDPVLARAPRARPKARFRACRWA